MKPNDPREIRPIVTSEGGFLRDILKSADADQAREEDLAHLRERLSPLFGAALPVATGGAKAATKLALVKAAAKSALTAKVALGVAAVAAASGGTYYVVHTRANVAMHAPAPSVSAPPPPAPPPATQTETASAAPDDVAPALSAKKPPRAPANDAAEFELVTRGSDALIAHRPGDALALANEHARRFPAGAHAEDRERIAIEALVDLGRADDAKARAKRFFARYPRSAYRPRIESLVSP